METGNMSSLQLGSVETFPPWGVLGLGVSKYFDPKKSDKKYCHNLEIFWTLSSLYV